MVRTACREAHEELVGMGRTELGSYTSSVGQGIGEGCGSNKTNYEGRLTGCFDFSVFFSPIIRSNAQ